MDFYLIALIGLVLSFVLCFVVYIPYIQMLRQHNINQEVSEYALDEYKAKGKTPIMGGLVFVVVPLIVYLIINSKGFKDSNTLLVIVSYILFCSVGFF